MCREIFASLSLVEVPVPVIDAVHVSIAVGFLLYPERHRLIGVVCKDHEPYGAFGNLLTDTAAAFGVVVVATFRRAPGIDCHHELVPIECTARSASARHSEAADGWDFRPVSRVLGLEACPMRGLAEVMRGAA